MTDNNCIFCKIVAGEMPAYKVYEDEHALAFLDIAPFERGHTLVISKQHARYLTDLPSEAMAHLGVAVQRVAALMLEKLRCDGFNLLQNNGACASQVVPHVHFHVIPRWRGKEAAWAAGGEMPASELEHMQRTLTGDGR